jgi:hypothetical protein
MSESTPPSTVQKMNEIGIGEVTAKLHSAYRKLVRNDFHLLEADANERSLTHKLAEYLQDEFPEWHVDCEYNRNGDIPKRLIGNIRNVLSDDTNGSSVFPDIIVHQRGTDNNLLVIEAKKSTTDNSNDEEKLRAYMSEIHYLFAFAIVFPVKGKAQEADPAKNIRGVQNEPD